MQTALLFLNCHHTFGPTEGVQLALFKETQLTENISEISPGNIWITVQH